MRKLLLSLVAVGVLAMPMVASAGVQCRMAEEFGWSSGAQNTACAYEWLFELMGGWCD